MIIRRFFITLQHYWWLIVISVLAGWSISAIISYSTIPLYRATISFIVYPNANLSSSRDVVSSLDTLDKQSVISTYADLLASNRVFQETVRKLKLKPADVENYTLQPILQTQSKILILAIDGPDPRMTALLANNVGQNGINFIKSIYQVFEISLLDQATVPTKPISPQPLQDGALAAAIGLLVGIFLAVVIEQVRVPIEALIERSMLDKDSQAFQRRHFERMLEKELINNPQGPTSLGLVHLEGLQDLIGILPESTFSDLLSQVTGTFRRMLRGNDIIGRWDKFTFSVMLPSTPAEPAARTLERIRQVLTEAAILDVAREPIKLIPRAGLSCAIEPGIGAITLIQQVEVALERSGKKDNSTVLFSEEKKG